MIATESGRRRRTPRWRPVLWGTIAVLLLLPLVAMRFTDEVAWGVEDFAAAGALLVGAGAVFELAVRRTGKPAHRVMIAAVLVGLVLTVWAHAAVGVF
ncbi:hypothetical protein HL658_32795 [Azospirillum sp. RWY-5-1]|uniref:Uncharacterized protein n=1 Tax=Azospirillum oleiclasticum TaxID=2735135 RepID=A0ABX2TMB0_9PROT|nr:hypothetical protein [Azospirillum oleiclasticum]NYZ17347.1 hypothetical protein [Azospirillum oleiclasticum]NYZ24711.1 hypothetical protein [Azospirillum oleiclasticum]